MPREFTGRAFSVSGSHWICGYWAEVKKEQTETGEKNYSPQNGRRFLKSRMLVME